MLIQLTKCSNKAVPARVTMTLTDRLPFFIVSDCTLDCEYTVRRCSDYFLLTLDVSGHLTTQCQRCLNTFVAPYSNYTELAICKDETVAEQLMETYESVVSSRGEVDLAALLTDELHLYAVEKHASPADCCPLK